MIRILILKPKTSGIRLCQDLPEGPGSEMETLTGTLTGAFTVTSNLYRCLQVAMQVLGLRGAQDLRRCPGRTLGPPGEAVVGTKNVSMQWANVPRVL